MKKSLLLMTVALLTFATAFASGRGSNIINLKSGAVQTQNDFTDRAATAIPSSDIFAGYYYRLIQFNVMPSAAQQKQLAQSGIKLLGYVPYKTFYAAIPKGYNLMQLNAYNARTILSLAGNQKLNNTLRNGDMPYYAHKKTGMVDLIVQYYGNLSSADVISALNKKGYEVIGKYEGNELVQIRVNENAWQQVASLPFIMHVEPIAPAPTADDARGRSMHRSNAINTDFPMGRHYDGSGVSIALGDDGFVGPHIDFTGRLTNIATTVGATHGDMTSGIAVGAGNLNPIQRGHATGAHIYVYDIGPYPLDTLAGSYPQIVDMAQHLADYGTTVTSTSYSAGCNDYDVYSQQVDRLVRTLKIVQPVWSGGNNNGADCGYGAGTNWGNITGGYKQGKNVIAVANVDANGAYAEASSHGPAADGRIKPDVTANGAGQMSTDENNTYQVGGGTSAACPSTAGTIAQLYQAYRTITGQSNPEAPLIKSTLQNTAEDFGVVGPDYVYGYGRINALRAVKLFEDGRFLNDSVVDAETNTHIISVPAGVQRLKVMINWLDMEGSPTAAFELVNDIDMTVTDPSSTVFQPWVLDPTPNATTLALAATRKLDTLNNMEQVTIDAPAAGDYTVSVTGSSIPFGPQKYYLTYEFVTNEITVTYPFGGEGFVPGETEIVRWDAFGTTGNFTLEYSLDNGGTWTNITSAVAGTLRQYSWAVPAVLSGQAKLRVTRGADSDMSDEVFSIVGVPANLKVDYACVDSLQLSWNAVTGATGYEVSQLGAMYMDSIATTAGLSVKVAASSASTNWFSVKAIAPNNGKGRRALAIQKGPGLLNCSLAADMASLTILSPVGGIQFPCSPLNAVPVTVQVRNDGTSTVTNFDLSYRLNGGAPVVETYSGSLIQGASVNYTFTSTIDLSGGGAYTLTAKVILSGDLNSNNDSLTVSGTVGAAGVAPLVEDFQLATFPPANWALVKSNITYNWVRSGTITGSSGAATNAAAFNNYGYNTPGAVDAMVTQMYDISALPYPLVTFDVAYQVYTGYSDQLDIKVSTDCGATFNPSAYIKAGAALATVPEATASFSPTAANMWRNDSLSLIPYAGNNIILKFENVNGYGNWLYVDNINLKNNLSVGINEVANVPAIGVYPNPSSGIFFINMENIAGKNVKVEILDMQGRVITEQTLAGNSNKFSTSVDLSKQPKGIYHLRVTGEKKSYNLKVTVM